ncbi:hypothetical protein E2C01_058627 [Portunus trituberculatus]|uniref:Uncharacterized protein n=1 Tax=Portunus trituberculatus TaxID=210409 RepID=A0A5B7GX09_PORTR|nr:hypothetical protein [Portunus trituberculatus]
MHTWQGGTGFLDFSFMAETGCGEAELGIPLGPLRHRYAHRCLTLTTAREVLSITVSFA